MGEFWEYSYEKKMAAANRYVLTVEVWQGPKLLVSILRSFPMSSTLDDFFNSLDVAMPSKTSLYAIQATEQATGPCGTVNGSEHIAMLANFAVQHVVFYFGREEQEACF